MPFSSGDKAWSISHVYDTGNDVAWKLMDLTD